MLLVCECVRYGEKDSGLQIQWYWYMALRSEAVRLYLCMFGIFTKMGYLYVASDV